MVLIRLRPNLARLLIAPISYPYSEKTDKYLENEISGGRWDKVPPIWITPNPFGFVGFPYSIHPDMPPWNSVQLLFKPFVLSDGHHRFCKALEHKLTIRAYIEYTPFNPPFPGDPPHRMNEPDVGDYFD